MPGNEALSSDPSTSSCQVRAARGFGAGGYQDEPVSHHAGRRCLGECTATNHCKEPNAHGQRSEERVLLPLAKCKPGNTLVTDLMLEGFGPGGGLDETPIS